MKALPLLLHKLESQNGPKAKQNPRALQDYLARRRQAYMVNQLYVEKKIELKAIYESLETEEEKREPKSSS